MVGGETLNLVLKKMLKKVFLKIRHLNKILKFQDWKKAAKLIKKENFKPQIKPMIENVQNEFYQLENKKATGSKTCANIS